MSSWLRAQKKSELVDIAETIGLKNVASLRKTELESSIDEYLTENALSLSSDPRLAPYYNVRGKSLGSPVKRESSETKAPPKRRSTTKVVSDDSMATDDEPSARSTALARTLARTPARSLSLASRIALPASPAEVAQAVDRSAVAVRERVVSIYSDSRITEVTQITRESLSTVFSIVILVAVFELYFLRKEVLPNRYVFTIPAIKFLHTSSHTIDILNYSLLLKASFWSPTLIWLTISAGVPALFGYFFNLSAANGSHYSGRGRSRPFSNAEYVIDPLTFSVARAVLIYVVLAQGVTFGGWLSSFDVTRIDSALYGGWKGALVGSSITGLASLYDAVLRK